MNCPKCFAKMPDDAKFCTECGTALAASPANDRPTEGNQETTATAKNKSGRRIAVIAAIVMVAIAAIAAAIGMHEKAEARRRDFEREMKRRQEELDRQCPNVNAHFDYFNGRKVHVEECRNCHGRGCYVCGGTGWMRCITCGGRGFVY